MADISKLNFGDNVDRNVKDAYVRSLIPASADPTSNKLATMADVGGGGGEGSFLNSELIQLSTPMTINFSEDKFLTIVTVQYIASNKALGNVLTVFLYHDMIKRAYIDDRDSLQATTSFSTSDMYAMLKIDVTENYFTIEPISSRAYLKIITI